MTRRGQREGQVIRIYLREGRAGSKAYCYGTRDTANMEGAWEDWRGEGGESGGSARGKDHITLRTSKQSRPKKRRKKQDDSLRSCAAALSNESN